MAEALLEAVNLSAGYNTVPVVDHLNLAVRPGEVVAILGPNGAGKTTTLLTLSGALPPISGAVHLLGAPTTTPMYRRVRRGLAFVSEERSVFMNLTVTENLRVGRVSSATCFSAFPELAGRANVRAGQLSGGEQQMLTVGRALGRRPQILLADELSLGLAPQVIARLMTAIREAADTQNVGALLVEQHVVHALGVADRFLIMRQGRCVLEGAASDYRGRIDAIQRAYFGNVPSPG